MIPIVNLRPGLQGPVRLVSQPAPRALARQQSPALQAAASDVSTARAVSERIQANYPSLLEMVGKDAVDQAIQQSQDSLSGAQARYNDLLRQI